jgi:hypothetical protein
MLLLTDFYLHVKDSMQLSCSTVLTYNDEIRLLVDWFVIYRVCKTSNKVEQMEIYAINRVLSSLRKVYSKQRKREDVKKKENTIEELKAAKKWPQGGYAQLAQTVLFDVEWAQNLCESGQLLDSHTIKILLQILAASFYTSIA